MSACWVLPDTTLFTACVPAPASMGICILSVKSHFNLISYSCQKERESPQVNSKIETIAQNVCLGPVPLQPHLRIKISELLGSLGIRH